jgi:glycosyltransferase involved in cell wall biosynthesis
MPVYNGEKYIAQALDSFLRQTYTDFELIISDNASTDSTEAICRDYAGRDPRIRYERLEKNVGLYPNFDRVFTSARGEYFKWAAHDDVCAETFLEACVAALDADPCIVLSYCEMQPIGESGQFIAKSKVWERVRRVNSRRVAFRFRDVIMQWPDLGEIYGVIRTRLLKLAPVMTPYGGGGEKAILAVLCLRGRFHRIPKSLFFYRCHPAQDGVLGGKLDIVAIQININIFLAYWKALRDAPLPLVDRIACYRGLVDCAVGWTAWKRRLKYWLNLGQGSDEQPETLN